MRRTCSIRRKDETFIHFSIQKSSKKGTTWRSRRRWEDNIKMDLTEIGRTNVD
jgi:hypothetical protein